MKRTYLSPRPAFTLVELLVVIAIIGVLAGILIPTISGVVNNTKRGALKLETDELARAIERYRDKYGDYPPDGSDWGVFQRHLKKAFPNALATELALLDPTGGDALTGYPTASPQRNGTYSFLSASGTVTVGVRNYADTAVNRGTYQAASLNVMDPAEALVFFLGGFSSDPRRPFTGRGGPFTEVKQANGNSYSPPKYQYNVARENAFFEFTAGRLTISQGTVDGVAATVSSDEGFHGTGLPTGLAFDILPVYLSNFADEAVRSPYVYFDSRTYVAGKTLDGGGNSFYFNFYQRSPISLRDDDDQDKIGAIYPYYSDVLNSSGKGLPAIAYSATNPFVSHQFIEPTKFQIIGPGLDGKYGGRLISEIRNASDQSLALQDTMFRFPSGNSLSGQFKSFKVSPKYGVLMTAVDPQFITRMTDNVANFSAATLDAGQP